MPNEGLMHPIMSNATPGSESCPNCGGQWFTPVYRLLEVQPRTLVGQFATRYVLDKSSDGDENREYQHRAQEAFGCVACGAVVEQDREGSLGVTAPREGPLTVRKGASHGEEG